ncbi:MAG: sigma-70 family RNA polymerase sigma factor [Bacteroidota bacterium]
MGKRKDMFPDDEEIIQQIRSGGIGRQKYASKIYTQYMGYVIKGKQRYRLSMEEAQDAYADAVIGICRHIEEGRFRGESKLSTYLFKAFSNRCVDKLRRRASNKNVAWEEILPTMPDKAKNMIQELILKEKTDLLLALMDKLGESCKKILIDSEYYGFSMDEIAERTGFKNAASVSSMKYKCMDKLRKLLRERNIDNKM